VVASEVKSLAVQTATATAQIGVQINQIQTSTNEAVAAIHAITATIVEVSSIATNIAAAVEEQTTATAEIARNVQHTSVATQEVTININGVSRGSTETGVAAGQVFERGGRPVPAGGAFVRRSQQLPGECQGGLRAGSPRRPMREDARVSS